MGHFNGQLILKRYRDPNIGWWRRFVWGRKRWILLDEFSYTTHDSNGEKFVIVAPAGTVTDGGTIPRFCWWYVQPGCKKFLPAYVIHDIMCAQKEKYTRRFADDTFHDMLIESGAPVHKALIMYNAVSLHGEN